MDDFQTVKKSAWSLPPDVESIGELIYVEKTEHDTYRYYLEKNTGEYWYQSDRTLAFHKWMKEKEKEKKRCSKESRRGFAKSREQSA